MIDGLTQDQRLSLQVGVKRRDSAACDRKSGVLFAIQAFMLFSVNEFESDDRVEAVPLQ